MTILEVQQIIDRISAKCVFSMFFFRVSYDCLYKAEDGTGRIFIQVVYYAPCTKDGEIKEWKGRKWYLSSHMTTDEVIKTCYAAFEAAVKHEIMEGFKVDGKVLFNPHVSFESLLDISDNEVRREE